MLPLSKLLEIQDFALSQKFDVKLSPDPFSDGINILVSLYGNSLYYNSSFDEIEIEISTLNDDFESFVAKMDQLKIIEKIGVMIYEALGKEA